MREPYVKKLLLGRAIWVSVLIATFVAALTLLFWAVPGHRLWIRCEGVRLFQPPLPTIDTTPDFCPIVALWYPYLFLVIVTHSSIHHVHNIISYERLTIFYSQTREVSEHDYVNLTTNPRKKFERWWENWSRDIKRTTSESTNVCRTKDDQGVIDHRSSRRNEGTGSRINDSDYIP